MPWWIWLLLALFMLAMLIAGIAYAILRAIAALRTLGDVGEKVSGPLSALGELHADGNEDAQTPSFAEPLRGPLERYIAAHAALLSRKARKEDRHADVWRRWAE